VRPLIQQLRNYDLDLVAALKKVWRDEAIDEAAEELEELGGPQNAMVIKEEENRNYLNDLEQSIRVWRKDMEKERIKRRNMKLERWTELMEIGALDYEMPLYDESDNSKEYESL
jgi:hypothetical protein